MVWKGGLALTAALLAESVLAVDYDATFCGTDKYTSKNGEFFYGSNAWSPVGNGYQCMSVQDSVPALDATWMWSADPTNVHSFPHVRFMSKKLPTPLSTIKSMRLKTQWTMSVGNGAGDAPRAFGNDTWQANKAEINKLGLTTNAAWDFFADVNKTRTYNPVDADNEIMIWIGLVGNPVPLKGPEPLTRIKLANTEFELQYRKNFRDHNVFTWVTTVGDINTFDEDVYPLFKYIMDKDLISKDAWLGLVEFGSETWYAPKNITFTAANYAMELDNGDFGQSGSSGGSGSGSGSGGNGGNGKNAAGIIGVSLVAVVVPVLSLLALGGW